VSSRVARRVTAGPRHGCDADVISAIPAECHSGTVTGHAITLAGLASAACLSARLQSNCWPHQPCVKVPGSPIRKRRRRHLGRTAPWRTGHCRLRHRCRVGGRTGSARHATAPFTRHSASRCLSNVSPAVPGGCSRVAARSALCGPCWKGGECGCVRRPTLETRQGRSTEPILAPSGVS
jgi:hypothetical protein